MGWTKPTRCRAARVHLALILVLPATACGDGAPRSSVSRLVDEVPARQFVLEEHAAEPVVRWHFATSRDLEGWTTHADRRAEVDRAALWLAGSDRSSLVRGVDLAADEVDMLQAELEGVGRGQPAVFWAAAGEAFSADRSVRLRPVDREGGRYVFHLSDHPRWSGRIRRLRLDVTNVAGELVAVRSVALARRAEQVDGGAFERPWRLEVDNEMRPGFVVAGGRPHEASLLPMEAGRLHFAFALLSPPVGERARFFITRMTRGGAEREVFSQTLGEGGAWATASVPLELEHETDLAFAVDCPSANPCLGAYASIEMRNAAAPRKPNIVLISLDTLRADRMSLYGHERPTTPHIDRWAAASGVTFERAVAPAPWTLPAHVSMLTGLHATTHGANHPVAMSDELELLAERLRDQGYFTAAVTGGGYMSPDFGFWQGFDAYRYWTDRVASLGNDAALDELPGGVDGGLEMIGEAAGRPFFLLFHTYAIHAPYRAHAPYFERLVDGQSPPPGMTVTSERLPPAAAEAFRVTRRLHMRIEGSDPVPLPDDRIETARAMYDAGIARADAEVGRLFDVLAQRGLLDDTLVILTSDHGEMLGEHGLGGHAYLHDENLLVPLVFSWPGRFQGGARVGTQVRTVDIVPTVLALLGADSTGDELDGVPLLPWLVPGRQRDAVPDAVSYAAASNRGISLRVDDGIRYVYDNTLWRSGVSERITLPPTGTGTEGGGGRDEEVAALRARVEKLLEARRGLHMLLHNSDSRRAMRVRLRGSAVHLERVKATGLECACARWLGSGEAEIRVEPGAAVGVQFEAVERGLLDVEATFDGESTTATIDLADVIEPWTVRFADGVWAPGAASDDGIDVGLALWWQGDSGLADTGPMDAQLRRRLRALGYVQ